MRHRKPISRSRTTGYSYEGTFDEPEMGRLLEAAQTRGVVTTFDTGRGRIVWFHGAPVAELRAVRRGVRALMGARRG